MFIRRRLDRLVIPLIALLTIAYFSYHPRFQLTTQMPREFLDTSISGSAARRATEEKIARAYWACAVDNIQWQYSYGYHLPPDPPPVFTVTNQEVGADPDGAARTRYWRKLQQVWSLPGAWHKTYVWDFRWTISWVKSTVDWLYTHVPALR